MANHRANEQKERAHFGDLEATLRALRAWLEESRRAWQERNLKKLIAAEQGDIAVEQVQAEHRKKLEFGHSRE